MNREVNKEWGESVPLGVVPILEQPLLDEAVLQ
jgi:hypothetical protein